MKRIITCILAVTFLFILFYAPIYIPNEEFLVDVKSACIKGKYYDEYLTEEELLLIEKWLPSLRPRTMIGIEDCMGPEADFISLHLDMDGTYMHLTIPALYFNSTPDFAEPVRISGALKAQYVSQNHSLTWEVYDMLQDVHARREDNFKKLLESKKAAN